MKESEPLASGVTHTVQNDYKKARPIIRVAFLGQSPPTKGLLKPMSKEATEVKYGPGYRMVKKQGFKDGGGLGEELQGLSSPIDGVTFSRWPGDTSGLGAYCSSRYAGEVGNKKIRKRTTGDGESFTRCPPPEGL